MWEVWERVGVGLIAGFRTVLGRLEFGLKKLYSSFPKPFLSSLSNVWILR